MAERRSRDIIPAIKNPGYAANQEWHFREAWVLGHLQTVDLSFGLSAQWSGADDFAVCCAWGGKIAVE